MIDTNAFLPLIASAILSFLYVFDKSESKENNKKDGNLATIFKLVQKFLYLITIFGLMAESFAVAVFDSGTGVFVADKVQILFIPFLLFIVLTLFILLFRIIHELFGV